MNITSHIHRFKNEIQALKKNRFILVKLEISKELQLKRIKNTYPDTYKNHLDRLTHYSETQMDSINNSIYDMIINVDNDDLFKKIDNLFN